MRLLFVCSGNTCRSAMAEVIARSELAARGASGVELESAGTHAAEGDGAMPEAIAVAQRRGLDLEGHATKPLTASLVESADHVLVMKPEHGERVRELVRGAAVTCLDVEDPIGRGASVYEETWMQLQHAIGGFLDRHVARS
jgi:protein-tyrosine-phosphatase